MAIRERLIYAIDLVTDGANKGLASFRSQVAQAEGATGKFKAGAGAALESVKANAGALALGGGAALVAFGAKAVGAFQDTAKAALDGSKATGLNVEQMSRWIAVGDDFQVSADQLVTGIGRIGKTLDSGKWEQYGVETRDAAGNARDANDVLIDTLDMLGKVENQTERTRIGNDLFGKGYANLAPLIGKTRSEYEDMLGSVEKGQVITAAEAATAEKSRLAMDRLQDAVGELTLELGGGLAPAIADVADGLSDLVTVANKATGPLGGIGKVLGDGLTLITKGPADLAKKKLDEVAESSENLGRLVRGSSKFIAAAAEQQDRYTESLEASAAEQKRSSDYVAAAAEQQDTYVESLEASAEAEQERTEWIEKAAEAQERQNEILEEAADRTDDLISKKLELVGGEIAVHRAAVQAKEDAEALNETIKDGSGTFAEFDEQLGQTVESQLAAASAAAQFRADQMAANGTAVDSKVQTQLFKEELQRLAEQLDGPLRDALDRYIRQLGTIPTEVSTNVRFNSDGDMVRRGGGPRAAGGPTFQGMAHPIGENGTEVYTEGGRQWLVGGANGRVTPASPASAGGDQYVFNIYGDNPAAIRREVESLLRARDRRARAGRRD